MQPSQNVWPHLVRTGALSESQQIGQRSSRSVAVAEVLVMCRYARTKLVNFWRAIADELEWGMGPNEYP